MLSGLWGKKIGITQVFHNDKVIPVTVIDVGNWVITDIKTVDRDGYNAIQVGAVRKRYAGEKATIQWVRNPKEYFTVLREIRVDVLPENIKIGKEVDFYDQLEPGKTVDVFGITIGRGFAGVIKRHSFRGPPASHGSTMGRRPGSIGHMRARGRVIKGKRMPGHLGVQKCVMKNLEIVEVKKDGPVVLVKGSVPGYAGSLVFIRKQ